MERRGESVSINRCLKKRRGRFYFFAAPTHTAKQRRRRRRVCWQVFSAINAPPLLLPSTLQVQLDKIFPKCGSEKKAISKCAHLSAAVAPVLNEIFLRAR